MGIALTGFLTGFAKGAKERIEKESEENEALIANRLKMAQTTRLVRQKEQEAKVQLLTSRYKTVSPYLPPEATEEQKMALMSNEEIATQYAERRKNGETIDLDNFLIINKDKIPKGLTSVQQMIEEAKIAPAPIDQAEVDAIRQTKGFLGARTGPNVDKMAQQFGVSARDLLAYEKPQDSTDLTEFASINPEALKKPKGFDDRIAELETQALTAGEAGNKEEFETIRSQISTLTQMKDSLSPPKAEWAANMSRLKMLALYGTPEEKAKANKELDAAYRIEQRGQKQDSKVPPASELRAQIKIAFANDIEKTFGTRMKDNWTKQIGPDGIAEYKYTGSGDAAIKVENEIQRVKTEALQRVLFPYVHNGKVASEDVSAVARAYNFDLRRFGQQPPNDARVDESNPLLR